MSNPYAYSIGGVALLDHCESVRILGEVMAAKRGENFTIPGIEGELSFPGKLHAPLNLAVECTARFTNSAGLVTHVNGAAGHVHENVAKLKELFGGTGSLVDLQRTGPHEGVQILSFEVLAEAAPTELDWRFVFICHAPSPFWRSTTQSSYNGGTGNITRGGNAPVHDAVITFTGAGSIKTNDNESGVEVTGACVVDCGKRTVTVGGNPAPGLIRPLTNRWLQLKSPTVAVTVTGSPTVTWFPKWR